MDFKQGDEVLVNGEWDGKTFNNHHGVVIYKEDEYSICIAFYDWDHGHDAAWIDTGYVDPSIFKYKKQYNCWFVNASLLTLIKKSDILDSKYNHVIYKIKTMEKRRAELGYKTYQL